MDRLLTSPEDGTLVAWPAYLDALQAFDADEPTYLHLYVQGNASENEVSAGAGGAKFAYIVPDSDDPTGRTLTFAERHLVLECAAAASAIVIEDGGYSERRYEGEQLQPLFVLSAENVVGIDNGRVAYCGTFSKTLSLRLRVGWVAAPFDLIEKLVLVKQASDLHSPNLYQMVLARVAETIFDN